MKNINFLDLSEAICIAYRCGEKTSKNCECFLIPHNFNQTPNILIPNLLTSGGLVLRLINPIPSLRRVSYREEGERMLTDWSIVKVTDGRSARPKYCGRRE